MANDIAAFGSALYGHLDNAATVPVYMALAPQGSTPPYCVMQRMAANDSYTFTSHEVKSRYAVKVVSNRQWAGEAINIYSHIHEAMQNANLSITGFQLLRCERETTIEYIDPDRYWHVGGVYRIEAQATS